MSHRKTLNETQCSLERQWTRKCSGAEFATQKAQPEQSPENRSKLYVVRGQTTKIRVRTAAPRTTGTRCYRKRWVGQATGSSVGLRNSAHLRKGQLRSDPFTLREVHSGVWERKEESKVKHGRPEVIRVWQLTHIPCGHWANITLKMFT